MLSIQERSCHISTHVPVLLGSGLSSPASASAKHCLRHFEDEHGETVCESARRQNLALLSKVAPPQEDSGIMKPCSEAAAALVLLPGSVVTEMEEECLREELLLVPRSSKKLDRPSTGLAWRHSEPRLQTGAANESLVDKVALEQARLQLHRRRSSPACPVEAWSGREAAHSEDTVMAKVWSFLTPHWMKEDYTQHKAAALRCRSRVLKEKQRQQQMQLLHASSGKLSGHSTRQYRRAWPGV
eukprot:TRINITY_DN35062_c0_g1_i1.p1 TRINITY_DN35062_c0_g1~~TRINITY_DN35062_c0_g1_i1.p1  ORF type:complete len:242 (-),score=45.60 TRINITY_DN35062_c0_g1_i1:255-980(-)